MVLSPITYTGKLCKNITWVVFDQTIQALVNSDPFSLKSAYPQGFFRFYKFFA
jgi:hypothetical protein